MTRYPYIFFCHTVDAKCCINILFTTCFVAVVNLGWQIDTPGKRKTQMKNGFYHNGLLSCLSGIFLITN